VGRSHECASLIGHEVWVNYSRATRHDHTCTPISPSQGWAPTSFRESQRTPRPPSLAQPPRPPLHWRRQGPCRLAPLSLREVKGKERGKGRRPRSPQCQRQERGGGNPSSGGASDDVPDGPLLALLPSQPATRARGPPRAPEERAGSRLRERQLAPAVPCNPSPSRHPFRALQLSSRVPFLPRRPQLRQPVYALRTFKTRNQHGLSFRETRLFLTGIAFHCGSLESFALSAPLEAPSS